MIVVTLAFILAGLLCIAMVATYYSLPNDSNRDYYMNTAMIAGAAASLGLFGAKLHLV